MPRVKTILPKKPVSPKVNKNDDEGLIEFEQFLAQSPKKGNKGNKSWLFMTMLIVVIILGVALVYLSKNTKVAKNDLAFKAIYIDNGDYDQVYYAKVVKEDAYYIYLDEVYYIEVGQQVVPPAEEGGEQQLVDVRTLVPRGVELHKPQGYMQINRDKVIAIEEIGQDSEIIKEINRISAQK